MFNPVAQLSGHLTSQPYDFALVLALWMGWRDLKTRRIPTSPSGSPEWTGVSAGVAWLERFVGRCSRVAPWV
jgi:hypothetical protein